MTAATAVNRTPMQLMKYVLTAANLAVITAVLEVMQAYEDQTKRQLTFPRARLLSEGAFQQVSAKSNPEYCYLMIVLANSCERVHGLKQLQLSEHLMTQQESRARLIENTL